MTSENTCSAILEKLHREAGKSLTNHSVSDSAFNKKHPVRAYKME